MGKGIFDFLAPVAGTILGSAIGMPWLGAAVGSGLNTGIKTGNPLSGLLAAGGTYAGNALGSAIGSSVGGVLGSTPAQAVGSTFGGDIVGNVAPLGSSIGNLIGSGNVGGIVGSSLGSSAGEGLGNDLSPMKSGSDFVAPGYAPSQTAIGSVPSSLSQFGNLSPQQQSTNLATQGVYGGGLGGEETSFFKSLINNRLVDQGGAITGNYGDLAPIEQSYLWQLGYGGGYDNTYDFLKALNAA